MNDILLRRQMPVEHERDRINLENVVLSSFRVIEVSGISRYSPEKARDGDLFLARIARYHCGHGIRRRSKSVTWLEAMDAQHLAESVFHQALWQECSRRGRPEGTDEELRYLLQHMYPFLNPPDWLELPFAELGNITPIEASRQPGGPQRVEELAKRLANG